MNPGNALAQSFQLPAYQQQQPQAAPQVAAQPTMDDKYFGIPDIAQGLQYTDKVGNISRDYANRWSALKNFAHSMQSMYGIDVTKPDPSRPESVYANQAFHQELGNLQYLGDMLKGAQTDFARKSALQEQNKYEFNPATVGNVPQNMLTPDQAGQSLEVSPQTQFVQKAMTPKDTQADYQRDVEQRQRIIAAQPNLYQQQTAAAGLSPSFNVPTENNFAKKLDLKTKTGFNEIKLYTNHSRGVIPDLHAPKSGEGYYSDGMLWPESQQFHGRAVDVATKDSETGKEIQVKRHIDKTVVNPLTGEVREVFQEKETPPMRVDNMPVNAYMSFFEKNGNVNKTAVDEFLATTPEALDSFGNIIPEGFLGNFTQKERENLQQVQHTTDSLTHKLHQTTAPAFSMKPTGSGVFSQPFWWAGDYHEFKSPVLGGATLKIRKNDTGTFRIVNWGDVPESIRKSLQNLDHNNLSPDNFNEVANAFKFEPVGEQKAPAKVNPGGKKLYE